MVVDTHKHEMNKWVKWKCVVMNSVNQNVRQCQFTCQYSHVKRKWEEKNYIHWNGNAMMNVKWSANSYHKSNQDPFFFLGIERTCMETKGFQINCLLDTVREVVLRCLLCPKHQCNSIRIGWGEYKSTHIICIGDEEGKR